MAFQIASRDTQPDAELDAYCGECVSRYAGRPVSMAAPIDDGPPYVYGRDYSLAAGSTYGWIDEHGTLHTEVVADGPDITDPVRRALDRITEIRTTMERLNLA